MPRINLLPVKAARRREQVRNEMVAVGGVIALTIVGLFSWFTAGRARIGAQQDALRTLEVDIENLAQEVKKVEDLKAKEQKVQQKLSVIAALNANRTGPVRMMDELSLIVTQEAKRVWLRTFEHRDAKLMLGGSAMDHEDISEFQIALERRAQFKNIKLGNIARATEGEIEYLTWTLECETSFSG